MSSMEKQEFPQSYIVTFCSLTALSYCGILVVAFWKFQNPEPIESNTLKNGTAKMPVVNPKKIRAFGTVFLLVFGSTTVSSTVLICVVTVCGGLKFSDMN